MDGNYIHLLIWTDSQPMFRSMDTVNNTTVLIMQLLRMELGIAINKPMVFIVSNDFSLYKYCINCIQRF